MGLLREGATLIGFVWPAQNPELMQALQAKRATVLAIDCLPRQLSRAQKVDAVGLLGREGQTLRMTVIPTVYYPIMAGLIAMILFFSVTPQG